MHPLKQKMIRRLRVAPLAALLLAGCTSPRVGDPLPAAREAEVRTVSTCIVSDGGLREVRVEVDAATGDTTYQGRPFHVAFPLTPEYAAGAAWYETNEPIAEEVRPQENARGDYVKYGRVRALPADTVVRVASHHGVGVYMTHEDLRTNEALIWVPVRPGCWFHHYQFSGVGELREGCTRGWGPSSAPSGRSASYWRTARRSPRRRRRIPRSSTARSADTAGWA